MTIKELCERFNIKPGTYHKWRERYPDFFPPPRGHTRWSQYGPEHVEALNAFFALKHHFAPVAQVTAYCAETGISLKQYIQQREQAIRHHGIGVG